MSAHRDQAAELRCLRALHDAALAMAAPVAIEPRAIAALLHRIVDLAATAVEGRDGLLILQDDPVWRDLLPAARAEPGCLTLRPDGELLREPLRPGGSTAAVLSTGEPISVPDTLEAGRFGPYPTLAEQGIRALALVPLATGGRVLGALSIGFPTPGERHQRDREAIELFGAHAAAALERVRLLHEEHRRANQAESLAGILARVGAANDLTGAMEALLRGAIALLGGHQGIARVLQPENDSLWLRLALDADGQMRVQRRSWPATQGETGAELLGGGGPVVVQDVAALDPNRSPLHALTQRNGMRSSVAVPIDVHGQRIGSLHVEHREPRFFGQADLALAEALAAQAGAAIERARLDTARREAVSAREEAQRRLASQAEELSRREAEATALRELDRLKDQFIAMISHELRTPLSLVFGYAELLQTQINSLDTPTMEAMVGKIRIGAEQLTRLVDDLLDFARIERGEIVVRPEDFDLAPVLRELVYALRSQPHGDQIELDVPARLPVHGDRTRVAQAVSHLLGNALKYAPAGPVALRAVAAEGVVRVEVEDQGPGISAAEQPRVWDKFYRGVAVSELNVSRGTGIGLAIVKTMVEAQRGRVGLRSVPGEGACFWFELPAPERQTLLSA